MHPATVESLLHKYNVPLSPCVDPLLDRFEHEELPGLVNYETMLQWLHTQRQLGQVSHAPDPGQYRSLCPACGDLNVIFPAPIRNQTVTLKKGRTDPRKASLTRSDTPPSQKLQRSKSWTQDKENELIRELSKSLGEQAKQVSLSLQCR